MVQSLFRKGLVSDLVTGYGQVIQDAGAHHADMGLQNTADRPVRN
jgi:hypothetical protein